MSHSTLLQVDGLVKSYGGLRATDHASLSVYPGEIHALIGPNGAGKTTLIHLISGALAPSAGRIHFDGMDVTHMTIHTRVAHGLARSFQITSIFNRLSVLDNLALAVQAHAGHSLNFWRPARRDAGRYALATDVAERVGLAQQVNQLAGALSHGEQRQLEVGLALATRPKLLLLDEPMAGMAHEDIDRVANIIREIGRSRTILMVEHNLSVVSTLCTTITVLARGRVLAEGDYQTVATDERVIEAYIGTSPAHV